MICKVRSASAVYDDKYRLARIAAGMCLKCKDPALPGRRRCRKCLDKRKGYSTPSGPSGTPRRVCLECRENLPLVPGGLCGKCCELMAKDALRLRLHSRCDEVGTLAVDLEQGERASYRTLRADKLSGQAVLPFVRMTGIPQSEPVEAPEYSVEVFSDAIRWEG